MDRDYTIFMQSINEIKDNWKRKIMIVIKNIKSFERFYRCCRFYARLKSKRSRRIY